MNSTMEEKRHPMHGLFFIQLEYLVASEFKVVVLKILGHFLRKNKKKNLNSTEKR